MTKPAPTFDCALCGRHISKTATHWVLRELLRRVVSTRCVGKHDLYDRCSTHGTSAGIAAHLGLWPEKQAVTRNEQPVANPGNRTAAPSHPQGNHC